MSNPDTLLLEAEHLEYEADGVPILRNISLQLHAGEMLGLVGPNGAGKSTLVKLLAGLLQPESGRVRLDGENLRFVGAGERARYLAYLEQSPQTHWPLSVEQIVKLGRLPHGHAGSSQSRLAIYQAMTETDLHKLASRKFGTLSEGEKLRVHLARMLASETPVLLADEPVAALDLWHQYQTMEQLGRLAQSGKGIIVVMHDLTLASRYCNRLLMLDKGRLVAAGLPSQVLTRSRVAETYHVDGWFDQDNNAFHTIGRLPDYPQEPS